MNRVNIFSIFIYSINYQLLLQSGKIFLIPMSSSSFKNLHMHFSIVYCCALIFFLFFLSFFLSFFAIARILLLIFKEVFAYWAWNIHQIFTNSVFPPSSSFILIYLRHLILYNIKLHTQLKALPFYTCFWVFLHSCYFILVCSTSGLNLCLYPSKCRFLLPVKNKVGLNLHNISVLYFLSLQNFVPMWFILTLLLQHTCIAQTCTFVCSPHMCIAQN